MGGVSLSGASLYRKAIQDKETPVVNITGVSSRESDGAVVVKAAASNTTTRDAVIEQPTLCMS